MKRLWQKYTHTSVWLRGDQYRMAQKNTAHYSAKCSKRFSVVATYTDNIV